MDAPVPRMAYPLPRIAIATADMAQPSRQMLARCPEPFTPMRSSAHRGSHCLNSGGVDAEAEGAEGTMSDDGSALALVATAWGDGDNAADGIDCDLPIMATDRDAGARRTKLAAIIP